MGRVAKTQNLPDLNNVIDMIAHRHKQVKEQFTPIFHFHLHGSAPLESLTTSDDQGKVMSAEPRFSVWRVVISIASRSQDHVDLDTGLKALFPKSKTFQLVQAELLGSAVHHSVA